MVTRTNGITTFALGVELELLICPAAECGISYALASAYIAERRFDHKRWYCPNGHSLSFQSETEEEKLRKRVASLEQARDYHAGRARQLAEDNMSLARSRRAIRGQVTKLKNKAAAGECAWCHQKFPDVAAHVATDHPDVSTDADDDA